MKIFTIKHAREFAKAKHAGQKRDFSGDDYVIHPMRVAASLYEAGAPTNLVIAALCHDVLEDTDATMVELVEEIGTVAANLVWWVSEPWKIGESSFDASQGARQPTKQFRKTEFTTKLRAAPAQAQTLKMADIVDNTIDMAEWGHMNTARAERFLNTKRTTAALLTDANEEFTQKAKKALDELDSKLLSWLALL